MSDFADSEIRLYNLVGHSSYRCAIREEDDDGIVDLECSAGRENCGYWRDVEESLKHSHTTSNYANWIAIARIGDENRFGQFDTLICDESHNLESLLCSLLAIKISQRVVFELIDRITPRELSDRRIENWIGWAKVCLPICNEKLIESRRIDNLERIKSTRTKRLERLRDNLITISQITDEWIVEDTDSGATLTPVFASNYAERYLFRGIPNVILSSATLTRMDFDYLGIDLDSYELFEIESGFDARRRPFYYWETTKIDYDMVEGQIIQVMNRMDRWIESRQKIGWKGIIHSISYKHAERIKRYSRNDILTHKSHNARVEIKRFMRREDPCVLASPVLSEGLDFAGDLARYQFIWKVPTKYSKDPFIAARKKRDKKYPLYLAAKDILQMDGRLCRSMDDFGETVLFDKHWGTWMKDAVPWPKYFRASWRTIKEIPLPLRF